MQKRTVPQSVFDSPEACAVARKGHAQACADMAHMPLHKLGEGNPNHPMYGLRIFGYAAPDLLAMQYKGATK